MKMSDKRQRLAHDAVCALGGGTGVCVATGDWGAAAFLSVLCVVAAFVAARRGDEMDDDAQVRSALQEACTAEVHVHGCYADDARALCDDMEAHRIRIQPPAERSEDRRAEEARGLSEGVVVLDGKRYRVEYEMDVLDATPGAIWNRCLVPLSAPAPSEPQEDSDG